MIDWNDFVDCYSLSDAFFRCIDEAAQEALTDMPPRAEEVIWITYWSNKSSFIIEINHRHHRHLSSSTTLHYTLFHYASKTAFVQIPKPEIHSSYFSAYKIHHYESTALLSVLFLFHLFIRHFLRFLSEIDLNRQSFQNLCLILRN